MRKLYKISLLMVLFMPVLTWGQASFLGLDGGLEGTATIDNAGSSTGPAASKWTRAGTVSAIAAENVTVRSGSKSLKISSTSTTLARIFSPTYVIPTSTTAWTVQYYRRSASTTNTQTQQAGVYRAGTAYEQSSGYTTVSAINTWEKYTYSNTNTTSTTSAAMDILNRALGSGGDMFIDDVCVYTGAVDVTAPTSPASIAIANPTATTLDVSWGAAPGGVDGGGYLVVRYAASPAGTDDPNINGIYASGNTVLGGISGTVVYQGTGLSFTDAGLTAATTYYYKVYTYDKAYNYSAETQGSAPTATTCTNPDRIEFLVQPSNVAQDVNMTTVTVRAYCNATGSTATAYAGNITLTSSNNGCGFISQNANAVNGVATFSAIKFTRSAQTGITLTASAAIAPDKISNTFDVTAPGGSPVNTPLLSENFEGAPVWGYAAGVPTVVGSGGTAGTDVIAIKTFSGNKTLVKSYSADNSSGERGTTNTITFNNQLIAASYDHAVFSFQLASLEPGALFSGAGADNGENMIVEINLNGSGVWNKLLTYSGNSNYTFPFSNTPVELLTYNANASYIKPSTQSAFSIQLPDGTTQFQFRVTATNNRTNENWGIDNIALVGVTNTPGITNPLPSVTNDNLMTCPNSNTTISLVTSNTTGSVGYSWLNSGGNTNFITLPATSNPVVNPPAAEVYTATITDGDGCKASGTYTLTIPGGVVGTWAGTNNSDWFECKNWGGGVVPISTTPVIIPLAALNNADIDPLSTFASLYGGIANANNIDINNKLLSTQANAVLTVAGNLTIQNAAGRLDMTNGGQVNLSGSWTNSVGATGFISGAGTINYAGSSAQTIAPENYYNLNSSSTGTRTMSPTGTVGIANIFTPFTNTYTFTNSTVDYNGSGNQNIAAFTANAAIIGRTYNNLALSNAGIKSVVGNTDIEGALSINNTITLAVQNNFVNLKSTATQTARVAPVSSTAAVTYGASGSFVVERYFPGRRAWRLITGPVTTKAANSIFNSWQVGGPTGASSPVGSGTYVTGLTPGSNGMDVSPVISQPSLKTFNSLTSNWDAVPSTLTTLISGTSGTATVPDNKAFFMFVRGDRTPSNTFAFSPYNIVNETTLRDTGKIQVQSYEFQATPDAGVNKYTVIGNPYASPVDFGSAGVIKSGVVNKFQAWDPKLNVVGGYVVVDLTSGPAVISPVGSTQTQIIQSSQAIVLETNNPVSPKITFNESAKSSADNRTVFRPSGQPTASLAANLHTVGADGNTVLADGALVIFGKDFSNEADQFDAIKWYNINETFSVKHDKNTFILERRQPLKENDTIFLDMKRSRQLSYKFNFMLTKMSETRLSAYLEDSYLHTSKPINMEGDSWIDFKITGDASSSNQNRFYIVFKRSLRFNLIKAIVAGSDVAVKWSMNEETDISRYEIERSADGETFESIGTSNDKELIEYKWLDKDLSSGIYYYRVKAVSLYGAIAYSDIVKVKLMSTKSPIYVFPNPVTNGNIGLQFNSQAAGKYGVRLMNKLGQVVLSKQLVHAGGTASYTVAYSASAGSYQLEVTAPNKKQTVLTVQLVQ